MNRYLYILSVAILLCIPGKSHPHSRVAFKSLSEEVDLPHSDINAIVQDKTGYIWIATYGGLCRYDGTGVKIYRADNSGLSRDRVICLHCSKDSLLYIGTESGGLNVYDPHTDMIRQVGSRERRSTDDVVSDIFEDGEGNVWFCHNNTLSVVDKDGSSIACWSSNGKATANCGLWTGGDSLMFSTTAGLMLYKSSTGECRTLCNSMTGASAMEKTPKGTVIVGTYDGIWEIGADLRASKVVSSIPVRSLCFEDNSSLWVGTYEQGLYEYDHRFRMISHYEPNPLETGRIASSEISALCIDRSGLLWIGTIGGGLDKLDLRGNNIECYTMGEGLSRNRVITFMEDPDKKLWISTHEGGIDIFDRKSGHFRNMRINSRASSDFPLVSAFWQNDDSRIWMGTWNNGIWIVDRIVGDNIIAHKLPGEQIRDCSVYKIISDRDGHIWFSTNSGLFEYMPDTEEFREYRHDNLNYASLSSDFITDILDDPDTDQKTIWVGTRAGLDKLVFNDDGTMDIHRVSMKAGKDVNQQTFVSAMLRDSQERLWIATLSDGLFEMKGGRFTDEPPVLECWNSSNCGFASNELESLQEDAKGRLWIGGYGIARFNPEDKQVKTYTEKDNLQSNSFKIWASCRLSDGSMVFGGTKGFNIFHPDSIRTDTFAPPTAITSICINGKEQPQGSDRIVLKHNENNISIRFAALNFRNPECNRYLYKLEGYDKDFRQTNGKNPMCEYSRLKRGNYRFMVIGSNSDGIPSVSHAGFSFRIKPHFLLSNVALVIYGLAAIALIWFIWQFSLRQMRIRSERQVQEDKLRFFTDMAHEIKTPLSLISAPVEELLENQAIGSSTRSKLQTVNRGIISLRSVVNQILDLRKYEDNMMKLSVSEVDLCRFLSEAATLFEPLSRSRKINFRTDIHEGSLMVYIDKYKMERVVVNLLSNAFKFTKEGGSVMLSCYPEGKYICFTVEDNGVGMDEHDCGHIFERFYQGSNQSADGQGGTGIGLALSKHIINHHKGEITVESRPGFGSKFTVRLLKGCRHFKPEEINRQYRNSDDLSNYEPVENIPDTDASSGKDATILVVDDNNDLRNYLKDLLSSRYNVITADNGMRAYERAISEQPDLILSDIVMPEMNGIELCRRIKNNPDTDRIPVLLITARDLMSTEIESWDTGADGFISKPFHTRVLMSRIHNLIDTKDRMRKLYGNPIEVNPSDVDAQSADERFLARCIRIVEENMEDSDFGVEEFCREVGLSRPQLYRKLETLTGKSPLLFIRSLRLKRAAQLLGKGTASVSEVMYSVGFGNQSYFSKLFKAEFGCMPKDYGKKEQ
ncbi:MAG: two-component regulator propeller domain-containing protein [Candidatus Cryptobacteroides sp.]